MIEHAGIASSRIRVMYRMWGRCDGGDAGTRLDVVSMDGGVLGFIQSYVDTPMIYVHLLPLQTPQQLCHINLSP
jgi:hypothetical protein